MCDNISMESKEFIKRAKQYAKAKDLSFRIEKRKGKGSHIRLYLGARRTTVQKGNIPRGTLGAMFRQLDIKKEDF